MVTTDTVEGIINDAVWFHYDLGNDVLYLVVASEHDTPAVAEETPEGFLLERREDNGLPIGITVVNWWKRFGQGRLPDSLPEIGRSIETWAEPHRLTA